MLDLLEVLSAMGGIVGLWPRVMSKSLGRFAFANPGHIAHPEVP